MANASMTESSWARLKISHDDFLEVLDLLKVFDSNGGPTIHRAILTAAVVIYSRPFRFSRGIEPQDKKSFGSGRLLAVNLEPLTLEQEELHSKIIDLRDKAVAHSDYELNATKRVPAPPRRGSKARGFVSQSKIFDLLNEDIDLCRFKELASLREADAFRRLLSFAEEQDAKLPLEDDEYLE